ncbi:MAG: hypothetical protein JW896_17730 [Deltaproteobacteria bacterium]|nr:hypothetical protein [Deltaproteobacteria bacterium]
MKRIYLAAIFIFLNVSFALCDEIDDAFQNTTTQEIKSSTRLLIQNGIPGNEAIKLTRLMIKKQFKQKDLLRAHEIIMKAKQEGLPPELIMSKIYEGIAKQVRAESLLQAMERVCSRYTFANEQAKKMIQKQDQVNFLRDIISDSSAAGLSNEDIDHIMSEFQKRAEQMERIHADELAMESFKTARFMARVGVPSQETKEVISQALRRRYTAWDMITLRTRFKAQYGHSDPGSLAREYKRQIQKGRDAGALNRGGNGQFGNDDPGKSGSWNKAGGAGGQGGTESPGGSKGPGRGGRR